MIPHTPLLISQKIFQSEVFQSILLAAFFYLVAHVLSSVFARNKELDAQRFLRLTFRHIATVCFMVGLGFIWNAELKSIVVALGAATVGILVAFKEAWFSLLGFWVNVVRREYTIGDFIEVDGVRGRVHDISWLSTTLAETGPGKDGLTYSGRTVQIPNNRLLLAPIFIENLTGTYGAHTMHIPLPVGARALKAEALLLHIADKHCAPYYDDAEFHMDNLRRRKSLDTPSVHPKSQLKLGEEGAIELILRIVVPSLERLRVEQAILREFLEQADEQAWPLKA